MGSRRNSTILIAAVAVVLVLAALAHQPVTQRETPDQNVILDSNYQLTGTHDDDLVVVGTNINLNRSSSVSGKASLVGDNLTVAGHIGGDLTLLGKNLNLEPTATIDGDVRLMGSNVTVAGTISGNLVVNGGSVTIAPDTQIHGDINVACNTAVHDLRQSAASIECSRGVDDSLFAPVIALRNSEAIHIVLIIFAVFGTIILTGISVLLVTFFPRQISHIEEAIHARPRRFVGVGIASYALMIGSFAALVVMLAIFPPIGLLLVPIFLILALVLGIVSLTGLVTLTLMLGNWLLHRASKTPTPPLIAAVVGSLIVSLLLGGIALLPSGLAASFILLGILNSVGLGASLFTRIGTRPVSRTYFIQG